MAEKKDEDGKITFDRMPGSDPKEEDTGESFDLNFSEEIEEVTEDTEETPEEVSEETVAEEKTEEETVAEEKTEEETGEADNDDTADEAAEQTTEEESTDEEPEEVAELEEPEPEVKKPMVPKSRLDEVLAKQRKLQEQLDTLTAEKETPSAEPAPEPYDFDAKELEYQEHVLNGESDKAVVLRKEIRAAEKTQLEYEIGQKFNQHTEQSKEMDALQIAADTMEAKYPVFDKDSESFNEEYTQEVIGLRDAFMAQGKTPVESLEKAVDYVVKTNNVDSSEEGSALTTSTKNTKPHVDQVAKKRKEVSKKLKAAETQPPDMPGESSSAHGEKVVDITSMTEEEFNALPDATLKRLRGDIG